MNRIDRLTAIIIFLQGRKYVTVEELSERYGISNRTVYRDLAALQETGVPIGSEPGQGYFIVKGYHLPPVMFNRNEAASLLAAERLIQKWRNTELGKSYLSALDKIRAILPAEEKEYFETLDQHIQAFHYQNGNENLPRPDDRIFVSMQNAITAVNTKQELLYLWNRATDEIQTLWPQIPQGRFSEIDIAFGLYEDEIRSTLFYFIDNEIHHRGQGYVYLRSLDIEPPYFWEH